MDRYIDIRLLPDPEFPAPMLMNALFAKLHRGLVDHGQGEVGVSFPDIQKRGGNLGARLRLHGSESALVRLMAIGWLQGMRDHIELRDIGIVPADAKYRPVCRVQAKSNPERLRRRLMNRKGIGYEAAVQAIPDSASERLALPYVTLTSNSTRQQFRLFIKHGPLISTPTPGHFTHYGLSSTATIPWF